MIINIVRTVFKTLFLRLRKVYIGSHVIFDSKTVFEGNNKIGKHSRISGAYIGCNTYVGSRSYLKNCRIGRFCSIANDVKVIAENHPSDTFISTSPVFFSVGLQCGRTFVESTLFQEYKLVNGYRCIIGNDVWIGENVLIIGGITIGDGAIIGMGAIVTHDVPPYSIVVGVPAKIIKFRFEKDKIKKLLDLQWWNKSDEWLSKHAHLFNSIDNLDLIDSEKFKQS